MERCSLRFVLPRPADFNGVVVPDHPVLVDVWRVDASRPLNKHTLSWAERPPRVALLGPLLVRPNGTVESGEFRCPSGTYQTFELACAEGAGSDCLVDFVQNPTVREEGTGILRGATVSSDDSLFFRCMVDSAFVPGLVRRNSDL